MALQSCAVGFQMHDLVMKSRRLEMHDLSPRTKTQPKRKASVNFKPPERQLDGNSRSADLQLNTDATGQDTPDRRRTDALPKDTDDKSRAADKCQAAYQSKKADRSAEGSAQPRLHKKTDYQFQNLVYRFWILAVIEK